MTDELATVARRLGRSAPAPATIRIPTSPAEMSAWATHEASRWSSAKMGKQIKGARSALEKQVGTLPIDGAAMKDTSQISAWGAAYVRTQGYPDSPESVAKFGTAFLESQGEQIGVPPEFIVAYDLIGTIPTSFDEADEFVLDLGKRYAKEYGVPMSGDEIVSSCARFAMTSYGVDPTVFTVAVDSLRDGQLSGSELESIAVAAGAWAGAAIGQAFGIPAPIGAFLGSLATQTVINVGKELFGPSDRELQNRAHRKAQKARSARMKECGALATEAWEAYQDAWSSVVTNLNKAFKDPAIAPRLRAAGGLMVRGVDNRYKFVKYGVQYDVWRPCAWLKYGAQSGGIPGPYPPGCPYFTQPYCDVKSDFMRCNDDLKLWRTQPRFTAGAPPPKIRIRTTPYSDHTSPIVAPWVRCEPGARIRGGMDPHAALRFWNAVRIVAPDYIGESDEQGLARLGYESEVTGRGTRTGKCRANGVAQYWIESLSNLSAASALVMRDVTETASYVAAQEELRAAMMAERTLREKQLTAKMLLAASAAQQALDRKQRFLRSLRNRQFVLNQGLLAAGGGALAGWAMWKLTRRT